MTLTGRDPAKLRGFIWDGGDSQSPGCLLGGAGGGWAVAGLELTLDPGGGPLRSKALIFSLERTRTPSRACMWGHGNEPAEDRNVLTLRRKRRRQTKRGKGRIHKVPTQGPAAVLTFLQARKTCLEGRVLSLCNLWLP